MDNLGYQSPCCGYSEKEKFQLPIKNDYHKSIRNFITKKTLPNGCIQKCISFENKGINWTDRTSYAGPQDIHLVKNNYFQLRQLEIVVDNVCNLSCITCNSSFSSKWISENKRMGVEDPIKINYMNIEFLKDFEIWKNVELLIIYGGEPFYSKKSLDLINWLIDNNLAGQIELKVYSNGTILSDQIENIILKFKKLYYGFSIDGINEKFEILRWPAKWENVFSNLLKSRSLTNAEISINYTYSILNSINAVEDIEYFSNLNFNITPNILYYPDYFRARHLPDNIKKNLVEKYKKNSITQTFIPELLDNRDEIKYQEAISKLKKLDKFRHTNHEILFKNV